MRRDKDDVEDRKVSLRYQESEENHPPHFPNITYSHFNTLSHRTAQAVLIFKKKSPFAGPFTIDKDGTRRKL